jgi:hypothetical protein
MVPAAFGLLAALGFTPSPEFGLELAGWLVGGIALIALGDWYFGRHRSGWRGFIAWIVAFAGVGMIGLALLTVIGGAFMIEALS